MPLLEESWNKFMKKTLLSKHEYCMVARLSQPTLMSLWRNQISMVPWSVALLLMLSHSGE